ncbi:MAG: hypothetical protein M1833_004542 [Piccolia ochrophora]|nr:MAG: hypothetical protein M1833_004542 [Piccolia ochrophora]
MAPLARSSVGVTGGRSIRYSSSSRSGNTGITTDGSPFSMSSDGKRLPVTVIVVIVISVFILALVVFIAFIKARQITRRRGDAGSLTCGLCQWPGFARAIQKDRWFKGKNKDVERTSLVVENEWEGTPVNDLPPAYETVWVRVEGDERPRDSVVW